MSKVFSTSGVKRPSVNISHTSTLISTAMPNVTQTIYRVHSHTARSTSAELFNSALIINSIYGRLGKN